MTDAMFSVAVPAASTTDPSDVAPAVNVTVPVGVLPEPVTWAVRTIGCAYRALARLLEIVVTLAVPAAAAGPVLPNAVAPARTRVVIATNAEQRCRIRSKRTAPAFQSVSSAVVERRSRILADTHAPRASGSGSV